MSCRSQSPPPRAPTPEVSLLPLPIRGLNPSRSCDFFPDRVGRPPLRKARSSKSIVTGTPSSPSSSSFMSSSSMPHSPTTSTSSSSTRHRYRSPPPSPAVASPPPPVPPIPEFILGQTDMKPVLRTPVMIPTRPPPPSPSDEPIPPIQTERGSTSSVVSSPPKPRSIKKSLTKKRSSVVMTCARFFMERNPASPPSTCAV
ncbi:hypothetical protein K435DRAFT_787892 [Dendrothele bispora CBS 962.96]|uniref:Uncharacterized protein n=1 Tax=Dendrothele bispora (strain CBS 962.96) TaxID=1314807 RepID=A0A4S8MZ10_DENBC|nr:hypothetical protein K435DRAFT_787892 [Dendrothele bispora CBS 962.96]